MEQETNKINVINENENTNTQNRYESLMMNSNETCSYWHRNCTKHTVCWYSSSGDEPNEHIFGEYTIHCSGCERIRCEFLIYLLLSNSSYLFVIHSFYFRSQFPSPSLFSLSDHIFSWMFVLIKPICFELNANKMCKQFKYRLLFVICVLFVFFIFSLSNFTCRKQ